MDPYSSHLPILQKMYKIKKFTSVFEFGCGKFSTPHFAANSEVVHAVEMQSHEWFEKMQLELKDYPNLTLQESLGAWGALDILKNMDKQWDLVFVDGHGTSRWNCINIASNLTTTIVAHDTEESSYGWSNIFIPDDFVEIRFKQYRPWTTVWTSDKQLIAEFQKNVKFIEGEV